MACLLLQNKPFQIHTTVTDQPEYIMSVICVVLVVAYVPRIAHPVATRVMWNTLDSSTPQVYYGLDSAAADLHTVAAETTTYTADDLCGEPATTLGWRNPGTWPAYGRCRTLSNVCACASCWQACCTVPLLVR